MNWHNAVLLGILEGLSEFLPVSSTGHLILLGDYLGANGEAGKTLDVVMQLGAVLAVVVYFRARLATLLRGQEIAIRRRRIDPGQHGRGALKDLVMQAHPNA